MRDRTHWGGDGGFDKTALGPPLLPGTAAPVPGGYACMSSDGKHDVNADEPSKQTASTMS